MHVRSRKSRNRGIRSVKANAFIVKCDCVPRGVWNIFAFIVSRALHCRKSLTKLMPWDHGLLDPVLENNA